jgi:DNA-binding transcriptional LysR family regulator
LDIQQLQAFISVAENASFSIAAQALSITQPAVSKRISSLETSVGCRLFDRIGRSVQLTEAGRTLRPQADDVLARLINMQRSLSTEPSRVAGVLRLATSHHIGLHRLAPVLRSFRQAYPDVQLDIRFEDSEIGHNLVRTGIAELAVVTLDPAGQEDLHAQALWRDPLVFITAAEHPLAGKRLRLTQLADLAAILPGPGTYTGKLIADLFARAGVRLRASMQTNYIETIRMLVAAGYGWSALPATMLGADLRRLRLVGGEPLERMLGVVTHPQRSATKASTAFLHELKAFAD